MAVSDRSPPFLKSRIFMLGLGLVLAGLSCRDAALAYWRRHALEEVPSLFEGDPQIMVARAEARLVDPASRSFVSATNAKRALRDNPLNATAMFELGMALEQQRAGAGHAAFALSEKLSRRELVNQIELLRLSAPSNDIAGALAHLDRIFLVSPTLGDKLTPGLALTLNDPVELDEVAKYAQRPWFPGLIGAAIDADVNPVELRRLLALEQGHVEPTRLEALSTHLLTHVIAAQDYGQAQDMVEHLPPSIRAVLDGIGFSAASTDARLAPLSWTLANDNAKAANLPDGNGLALSIGPEQTGILAERVTLFKPGRYDLTQTIAYDGTTPRAAIIWDVACEPALVSPIWHQPVPDRPGITTYRSTITIPHDCQAQHWRLRATGAIGQQASRAEIRQLVLAAQ
jgi:hypothetical protein